MGVFPPHEQTPVSGFHAYSQRVSIAPGEVLDVRVSGEGPVQAQVVRLGVGRVKRTPALTTRGLKESEMIQVADLIDQVLRRGGDERIVAGVRKQVLHLCRQFLLPH